MKNKLKIGENEINNYNENIFNLEEDGSENERMEKLKEMLEKNTLMAKQLQMEYKEFIIKANNEREKYIRYLSIYMIKYKI